jgi:hypothetical protein
LNMNMWTWYQVHRMKTARNSRRRVTPVNWTLEMGIYPENKKAKEKNYFTKFWNIFWFTQPRYSLEGKNTALLALFFNSTGEKPELIFKFPCGFWYSVSSKNISVKNSMKTLSWVWGLMSGLEEVEEWLSNTTVPARELSLNLSQVSNFFNSCFKLHLFLMLNRQM